MRARLALVASGLTVELREVELRDKPAAMLEASPKGTVPVLVNVDGSVIDESLDIMRWALGQHDPAHWLAPQTGTLDDMLALIGECDVDFKHHLDRYKYSDRYDGANALMHRAAGAEFLARLNARLSGHSQLFGQDPTLADMAIAPFVRQFAHTDMDWFSRQPWPALHEWLDAFCNSAAFARVMGKVSRWAPGGVRLTL